MNEDAIESDSLCFFDADRAFVGFDPSELGGITDDVESIFEARVDEESVQFVVGDAFIYFNFDSSLPSEFFKDFPDWGHAVTSGEPFL